MTDKYVFDVRKEVNPNFFDVWATRKPFNILKGGRGSFKSSVISMLLVRMMIGYIAKGQRVNVVCIRKTANNIRDSVYAQIIWALNKFNIAHEFKMTVSPFTIKHKGTGSTFYFYGHDDFNKLKSNIVDDLIGLWYEESADFKSAEEFDQTNATFLRQKLKSKKKLIVFWSYNPPRNPYHWINEWVDSLRGSEAYLIHESTYLDDELGFVNEQMMNEIERIKANDYDYYRYIYLGEAVGLGTNVYNMSLFKLINELPEDDPIVEVCYSADTGHQVSATSVGCYAITAKMKVIRLGGYYYEPAGKVTKKAPSELSKDIQEYIQSKGYGVSKYTIDSAEGALRNQYALDYGVVWHGVAKKEKATMIDYTHDLLAQGRFFVLNNEENKIFMEQCKKYEWDERTMHSDRPSVLKVDDHCCDEFQYFVTDNLRRLGLKH